MGLLLLHDSLYEETADIFNPSLTEVCDWESSDVCWWMGQLGLTEYNDAIHSHGITGAVLLELRALDLQVGRLHASHSNVPMLSLPRSHSVILSFPQTLFVLTFSALLTPRHPKTSILTYTLSHTPYLHTSILTFCYTLILSCTGTGYHEGGASH